MKIIKKVLAAFLSLGLIFSLILFPSSSFAMGFSGAHSSVSVHSSPSISRSTSSFGGSRSSNHFSGSSSKSSSRSSFSGRSSLKSSNIKSNSSRGLFSGKSSSKSKRLFHSNKRRFGSFSGATSIKNRGTTYRGQSHRAYINGHSVSVNHYYNVGFYPSTWFGYYSGFTTGMFMGSLMHPWGYTYPIGGHYVTYGASPIAWIVDIISLIIVLVIIIAIFRALKPSKTYTRRF